MIKKKLKNKHFFKIKKKIISSSGWNQMINKL